MLGKLDDLLLDHVFETFSKKFQILTGKNCFFLARIFHILTASLVSILGFVHIKSNILPTSEKLSTVLLCLLVAAQEVFWAHMRQKDEIMGEKEIKETANIARLSLKGLRKIMIAIQIFMGIFYINLLPFLKNKDYLVWSTVVCQTIYVYFTSCSPLPPCTSKVKEWLQNKLAVLKTKEVPT